MGFRRALLLDVVWQLICINKVYSIPNLLWDRLLIFYILLHLQHNLPDTVAPPTARDVNCMPVIHGYLHSLLNILLLHARVCASKPQTVKHKHSILESSVSYALGSIILVLTFTSFHLILVFSSLSPSVWAPIKENSVICKILHDVILLTSSFPASIATTLLDF